MLTKEKVWQLAEEAGIDKAKFASLVAKEGVSEELMDEELDNVCGGNVTDPCAYKTYEDKMPPQTGRYHPIDTY